jgi:hypothetical protein
VTVDLFTFASPDRWTYVRNPSVNEAVVARLTPSRDAVLATWQPIAWCGISNPAPCEGGRVLRIIIKPQALPGAANLGDRYVPITLTVNGVSKHGEYQDFGSQEELGNDVTQAPIPNLHGFLLMVDYQSERALRRQLNRCREITVAVLGRRFVFACDGLKEE